MAAVSAGVGGPAAGLVAAARWRINVTANNGDANYINMVGVTFLNDVGADVTDGATYTSRSNIAAQVPANGFAEWIGPTIGHWSCDVLSASGGYPQWLAFEAATAVTPLTFTIVGVRDPARMPQDFDVQYSDDGTIWTTLQSYTGETGWILDGTDIRTFTIQ